MMKTEMIVDMACELGENPLWHPDEKRLYWTDITAGKLYRYTPETGEVEQIYEGEPVGGFTFQANGSLLLFKARGMVEIWRDGQATAVITEIPAEKDSRFNDVIADPVGRVFCGTMPTSDRLGRLYRLDLDGSTHLLLEEINISNGMGFTPDQRQLYYTESDAHTIYRFDYEVDSGALENQQVWLEIPEGEGVPDGLTVDAEGYVWSARWDGSALYRYTPDGSVDLKTDFPAKKVTSCIFGGGDHTDLYVTTALDGGTREEEGEGAGAIFRVSTPYKGLPEFNSRILI